MAEHYHEFVELVMVLAGSGMHTIKGAMVPLVAGDVFIITRKQKHGYRDTRELRLVNILFDEEVCGAFEKALAPTTGWHTLFTIDPAARSSGEGVGRLRLDESGIARMESWIRELETGDRVAQFNAQAWFMLILGELVRRYEEATDRDMTGFRLASALGFMEREHHRPVTLADIAAAVGLSTRTLLRRFTETLGMSPIDYLVRLRCMRASRLLAETGLSVTEIAFRTGFNDSNYFARQFRKTMNETPTAWRKKSAMALNGNGAGGIATSRPSSATSRPRRIPRRRARP